MAAPMDLILSDLIADSDTDSSDEEDNVPVFVALLVREDRARVRGYVDVIKSMNELEFRQHFRLTRKTFDFILSKIETYLMPRAAGGAFIPIPPNEQLYVFLWYIANLDSMREIGLLFGMSESSVHKIIRNVSNTFSRHVNDFIKWPTSEQRRTISAGFEAMSGFEGIVGAIDGTHIRIVNIPHSESDYYNRKKFPSIQLQVVVDDVRMITNINVGWPGSAHDARVFRNSGFAREVEAGGNLFDPGQFIIGDSAYPLRWYLQTVYKNNGHLTRQQKRFNRRISSARQVVERAIGLMKGRFRRLNEVYCINVRWICQLITSACALHNLCILADDEVDIFVTQDEDVNNYANIFRNHDTGLALRNRLLRTVPEN